MKIMKAHTSFLHSSRLFLHLFVVLVCVTVWSSLAVGGEIHDASQYGDLTKVAELLKTNPDLVSSKDTNGWMPLHWATMYGHKEIVGLLLVNKADVNAKDKNGETALHFAVMLGRQNLAELLLVNKAEVNAKDNDGQTPLFYTSNKDIVELLLKNKADVNVKDKKGFTALHRAIDYQRNEVAELLRQHGGHK